MRLALGIEYDGTLYHGWQRQAQDPAHIATIQACVEEALSVVANEPVHTICAGRTDAGVHAEEQVIHFDTEVERSEYSWVFGANGNLHPDIRLLWAKVVDETFHARYSPLKRSYRYWLYNHPVRPALWRQYATWYRRPLDEKRMQLAANYLLGEQDFTSLRGVNCQSKTPVREIFSVKVQRKEAWITFDICANSFLHHMVRNIMGVLLEVGEGKHEPEWVQQVLNARDRRQASVTAPANGLYLMSVEYPEKFQLPQKTQKTFLEL